MKRYSLMKQMVHDVINTLSCLLFESESPLAMECVYQLRLFQALEENTLQTMQEFQESYASEIEYFKKEYKISIHWDTENCFMKEILIFLLLNKKSCSIFVYEKELVCKENQHFNYKIFELNNGILNHMNFSERFTIRENSDGFLIKKI